MKRPGKFVKREYDKFCGGYHVAHAYSYPYCPTANINGIEFLFDTVQNEPAFCRADCNSHHWGYFLEAKPGNRKCHFRWADVSARYLLSQLRQGRWSRYVVFLPDGKYSGLKGYLFFRRDGTGFFKEEYPSGTGLDIVKYDADALPLPGAKATGGCKPTRRWT